MPRPRRPAGALDVRILDLLQHEPQPISALALVERIRADGERIVPSLVFRAIRKLVTQGRITKVHLARGYALARVPEAPWLCCSHCGTAMRLPDSDLIATIEAAAKTAGFRPSEILCEVPGRCERCQQNTVYPR